MDKEYLEKGLSKEESDLIDKGKLPSWAKSVTEIGPRRKVARSRAPSEIAMDKVTGNDKRPMGEIEFRNAQKMSKEGNLKLRKELEGKIFGKYNFSHDKDCVEVYDVVNDKKFQVENSGASYLVKMVDFNDVLGHDLKRFNSLYEVIDYIKSFTKKNESVRRTTRVLRNENVSANTEKKTIVIGYGRMNPPTKGHKLMIEQMLSEAKANNADVVLYLSETVDLKKNPLSFKEKQKYINKVYPNLEVRNGKNLINVLTELNNDYTDVIVICGEDRIESFDFIKRYNGVADKKGVTNYEFDSIEIKGGDRSEYDEKLGSFALSASSARKAAAEDDYKTFSKIAMTDKPFDTKRLYNDVRKGLKLTDSIERALSTGQRIDEARLNTHMTHFEDLVMLGKDGIEELDKLILKMIGA